MGANDLGESLYCLESMLALFLQNASAETFFGSHVGKFIQSHGIAGLSRSELLIVVDDVFERILEYLEAFLILSSLILFAMLGLHFVPINMWSK